MNAYNSATHSSEKDETIQISINSGQKDEQTEVYDYNVTLSSHKKI